VFVAFYGKYKNLEYSKPISGNEYLSFKRRKEINRVLEYRIEFT
jgi:hypothetical protein